METIKVCDAIMGSGKTSGAIGYMNAHPEKKFIFATPYLSEVKRIRESCSQLRFVEPSNKIPEFNFRKQTHVKVLISEGRNIVTTHQMFKGFTHEILEDVRRQGYTLILDEALDVLEASEFKKADLDLLVTAGFAVKEQGAYRATGKVYEGDLLKDLIRYISTRDLVDMGVDGINFWLLPVELLSSFSEVIILTYLFEGQGLYNYLKINDIPFRYIGVSLEGGNYNLADEPDYVPEYVANLREKITILDNKRLNRIGDDKFALSLNWAENHPEGVEQLRKNILNCYTNIWTGNKRGGKMWGCYAATYNGLKGIGYAKSFVPFNCRATNEYVDRNRLVYAVNIFMNVGMKIFYKQRGIECNDDAYALSTMVQWIWRSAIRKGEPVEIYIPSRRMRGLLEKWLDNLSERKEVKT